MTSNPLLSALRQYRHNHGEGFVFGYDKAETDRIVAKLVDALEDMIYVANMVDSWECFPSAPIEQAEEALAIYRRQKG